MLLKIIYFIYYIIITSLEYNYCTYHNLTFVSTEDPEDLITISKSIAILKLLQANARGVISLVCSPAALHYSTTALQPTLQPYIYAISTALQP